MIRTPTKKKIPPPAPKPAPEKIPIVAYPKGDDGEDVIEKIKKRRAKEAAQNESESAKA
jgi:hypothetical protein